MPFGVHNPHRLGHPWMLGLDQWQQGFHPGAGPLIPRVPPGMLQQVDDVRIKLPFGGSEIVDTKVLRQYLPRLRPSFGPGFNFDLRPYTFRAEGVAMGMFSQQAMSRTIRVLLQILSRHEGPSEGPSLEIITLLERHRDFDRFVRRAPDFARVGETVTTFACLAELASQTSSDSLSRTLTGFAVKHGQEIAQLESDYGIFVFVYSITACRRATRTDVSNALREILQARPNITEEIRERFFRHPVYPFVFSALVDVANHMPENVRGMVHMPPRLRKVPVRPLLMGRQRPFRQFDVHPPVFQHRLMGPEDRELEEHEDVERLAVMAGQIANVAHRVAVNSEKRVLEDIVPGWSPWEDVDSDEEFQFAPRQMW